MYDMIKRDIFESYTDVVDSLFNKCNRSERIGNTPIRVSDSYFKNNSKAIDSTCVYVQHFKVILWLNLVFYNIKRLKCNTTIIHVYLLIIL